MLCYHKAICNIAALLFHYYGTTINHSYAIVMLLLCQGDASNQRKYLMHGESFKAAIMATGGLKR
jgi:hypothetical protein